ncbi:HIT family protein [Limisalsivibrio acetivorans]|uniref:HIT family protein n=1 Tax=Limisalsivibrio acetivorans TaxID=1304888 RepID=UPI0003B4EBB6|nr:HIT domain-containing protein [Limisalsivibrio acetivorans]
MSETMDRLWAPWRMAYITGIARDEGCIFCTKPLEKNDRDNLILHRGEKAFVIMNLFPYNNGHLMVVPYKHTGVFTDLEDEELLEIMTLTKLSIRVFDNTLGPGGYNTGFNIGKAAGAGIDKHLHFHIVPRWVGDTNFMPAVGETKVISEHITATYDKLLEGFRKETA